MEHRFQFFRAGGVDQVSLRDGRDLEALRTLDPKLWVALAMPVTGVDLEPETLALLDDDKDGRIRKDDILAAVDWIIATFKDAGDVLKTATSLKLSAIADAKIVAGAKRMLSDLGKPDAQAISVEDATAITKAFSETVLNGDGIVIPSTASTGSAELRRAIEDIILSTGSALDRSGQPGVDQALADAFFGEIDQHAAWLAATVAPLGDGTAAAADALAAVRPKLDDYFTRCAIAAFDPRGPGALGGQDAELIALGVRTLSSTDDELAKLPLAHVQPTARLSLSAGLNPAWIARIQAFVVATVTPILGPRDVLLPGDLAALVDKLAPFEAWRAAKPTTKIAGLDRAWIDTLAAPELRAKLAALIAADAALAPEYDQIAAVTKAVRFQRDFGRIARNFVSFSDFYGKQDGVFQAGTLYLDARAMHLAVPVIDAAKHAALAGGSDACLAYCDISRRGEKAQIAVAITNGDSENVFVGRNGVFYDRKGQDWDATVARVVPNAISVREAFWSPYKKLVKVVEDSVIKRARAAEEKSLAKMDTAGKAITESDAHAAATTPSPPATTEPTKKIDLGTVAAIGVAIGGIGTLVGALLATMFGLGPWLPLGLFALVMMISGPSMLLAWLKLRRRNLGPILDANGWAVNSRARINVAFGAAMTELASLPKSAQRSLDDPFADKRTPWRRWVFLVVVLGLAVTWYAGKLDRFLPERVMSTTVLGKRAPAYVVPSGVVPSVPAPK